MVRAKNRTRWRLAPVNDCGRVIGEAHHSAKLREQDIALILELRGMGLSYRQIANKFDAGVRVTKQMVMLVCQGRRRAQLVMGHRLVPALVPDRSPATPDEFEDGA